LDTATANAKINQWVVNVKNEYKRTSIDLLRLNRNVRSHLHQYNHDDDIEEILYCEWPMLLIIIVMDVVGIGRRESREAAVEIQYPRATVPRVLFTSARGRGTVHVGARAVR
jgi:hypothetical protein